MHIFFSNLVGWTGTDEEDDDVLTHPLSTTTPFFDFRVSVNSKKSLNLHTLSYEALHCWSKHLCLIVSINQCDPTISALTLMLLVSTVKQSPPTGLLWPPLTPHISSIEVTDALRSPLTFTHTLTLTLSHTQLSVRPSTVGRCISRRVNWLLAR